MRIAPWIEVEKNPRHGANGHLVGIRVTLTWWEIGAWWRRIRRRPPRPGDVPE